MLRVLAACLPAIVEGNERRASEHEALTIVKSMEHFDPNESNGNAATKYIVEFSGRVNCEWLWKTLDEALLLKQQKQTGGN